jgi:acetolactate synthase-1/2/3 large subunit
MKTDGAIKFVQTLKAIGIQYVFGIPSGNWIDYMDAIKAVAGIEFVLVSNEASGGFMADACWRLTGKLAACFGTFGPGACNLTTGVCCGFLDRSPMLAFSDEMNDQMRPRITQMNIDHQALFAPITKWTTRLSADRMEETLYRAAQIALSEVPGPVHIGIPAGEMPLNQDQTDVAASPLPDLLPAPETPVLEEMASEFIRSQKPILALGISAVRADVKLLVRQVAEKYQLPVVLTPMAKGMLSEDHPLYAGVLAHALADQVGQTHQQADLVIGIGYDPVEINYEDWMPNVPLIHLDTVAADIDRQLYLSVCDVVGNLSDGLQHLLTLNTDSKKWNIDALFERRKAMFQRLAPPADGFDPRTVLADLRSRLPQDGIMTCDVGAHLHLIGQQWPTPEPELQLMTNGCSSMGYAVPAAIGAKLSRPEREVCCVVGDGGFLMMAGEMATAMRLGQRIIFVLMTDKSLSLIRIKQNKKDYATYGTPLYSPSYTSANSFFGVPVLPAANRKEYKKALARAFNSEGPVIIEAFIESNSYDDLVLRGNR